MGHSSSSWTATTVPARPSASNSSRHSAGNPETGSGRTTRTTPGGCSSSAPITARSRSGTPAGSASQTSFKATSLEDAGCPAHPCSLSESHRLTRVSPTPRGSTSRDRLQNPCRSRSTGSRAAARSRSDMTGPPRPSCVSSRPSRPPSPTQVSPNAAVRPTSTPGQAFPAKPGWNSTLMAPSRSSVAPMPAMIDRGKPDHSLDPG